MKGENGPKKGWKQCGLGLVQTVHEARDSKGGYR